ncbi:MAG: diadenylate cyclase [Alkalispirochaeta sp.]
MSDISRTTISLPGSERITLVCLSGLTGSGKRDTIETLVQCVVETVPEIPPSATEMTEAVFVRESLGSTSVGDGVAFPHAVVPAVVDSVVCVAAAAEPILWDPPDKEVRLVVLFVGGPESHLPVMSQVARALRRTELVETIDTGTGVPSAMSAEEISQTLRSALGASPEVRFPADHAWNRRMIESAVAMRRVDDGIAVALLTPTFSDLTTLFDDPLSREIEYFLSETGNAGPASGKPTDTRDASGVGNTSGAADGESAGMSHAFGAADDESAGKPRAPGGTAVNLKILPSRRTGDGALHNILEREYGRGVFSDLTSLVVIWGVPGSNRITRLLLHHFGAVSPVSLPPDVSDFVFARVMQLARDIAIEGREGKPVGASFVLGDVNEIQAYTTQMIINPFSGCPETERNILDPSLEETVKEFAKIDGAFVVHGNGLIEAAGTYLSVPRQTMEHDAGHGARHTSAQGITAVCDCVAIVVSESTRRISVFRRGERVEVV